MVIVEKKKVYIFHFFKKKSNLLIYFVTRKVKDKYILQKAAYFHCFGLERLPHMSRFELLIISDLDLDLLIISLFHLFIYIS